MIHDKTADATAALHHVVQQQQDRHDSATPSAPVDDTRPVQTGARSYPGLPLPSQHLDKPGMEADMTLKPQFMAPDYRGSGKLDGMVAIITGGDSGIGRAVAVLYAREGADVAIIYLNEHQDASDTQRHVEAEGQTCLRIAGDVRDAGFCQRAVEQVHAQFGQIDILVNNAGCNIRKPAIEISRDDWNTVLDTNLRGTFFVAQAVARKMIPRKYGRMINIGSVTSVFGYAGLAPYCASRGGVKQLTMSLADDWGPFGITVNCLAPGWFKTKQNEALYANEAWVQYLCDRIPLKRPGKPNDLDGAIVFLASDASEYITGQTLLVDGGIFTGATKATVSQS